MRKLSRFLIIIFLLCLFIGTASVRAADEQLGLTIEGSLLTEKLEVSADTRTGARGTYLSYGSATLTNKGNHVVNVFGSTTCYKTSDQVKVTLHLQRLVKGTWSTVTTLDTKIAYNDHYVSNSRNVTVTGGYYYRIFGNHVAIKGNTVESTTSATDGMWVSK